MGDNKHDLQGANERLNGALDRLERRLYDTKNRLARSLEMETRIEELARERRHLSRALQETTARAQKVEDVSKQVSTRIMNVMKKVQVALDGQGES